MENFPVELFLKIFRFLEGKQVIRLRRVSTRLKTVVDNLNCDDWKKLCIREFGEDVKKAYERSGLSAREFYKSTSLWSIVGRANLDTYDSAELNKYARISASWDSDRKFIMLKNGIISYPQYQEYQEICIDCGYYDLITYFDSETLCDIKTVCFDMIFDKYDENDEVIVFRENEDGKLFIVPKTNDNKLDPILIAKLKEDPYDMESDFFLAKNSNDVYYFQNEILWLAEIVDENGAYCVKKCELGLFTRSILCISKSNSQKTAILTQDSEILISIKNEFEYKCKIDLAQPNLIIRQLKESNIDWTCLEIYNWLVPRHSNAKVSFTKQKNSIIYQHGKIVIVGSKQRVLYIYNNPYKSGELNLHNAKPDLKIDLNIFHPIHEKALYKDIDQIDVVEIPNGHRIILIYSHRLVAVELVHTKYMKKSLKQIIKERRLKRHEQRKSYYDDYEDPYLDTPI